MYGIAVCLDVATLQAKWGALGLSRKDTLMDKDLVFDVRTSPFCV